MFMMEVRSAERLGKDAAKSTRQLPLLSFKDCIAVAPS
jgi:hypothetical protein